RVRGRTAARDRTGGGGSAATIGAAPGTHRGNLIPLWERLQPRAFPTCRKIQELAAYAAPTEGRWRTVRLHRVEAQALGAGGGADGGAGGIDAVVGRDAAGAAVEGAAQAGIEQCRVGVL